MGFQANLTCTSRSFFSDPKWVRGQRRWKAGVGVLHKLCLRSTSLLRRTTTYILFFQGRNETKSAENDHILGQSHQEANQALLPKREQSIYISSHLAHSSLGPNDQRSEGEESGFPNPRRRFPQALAPGQCWPYQADFWF